MLSLRITIALNLKVSNSLLNTFCSSDGFLYVACIGGFEVFPGMLQLILCLCVFLLYIGLSKFARSFS